MKTITEFPATLLRQAIAVRAQHRATESPAAAPPAPAEGEAPQDATPPSDPEAAALGAALGIEGQRLARLMEALAVVGDRVDAVNRVRVFGGEDQPQGGHKQGDFYYVVDLIPRPQSGGGRRNRDRPGGRDRGERGRGGPGGGPGGREREPPRSEVPAGGEGWTLARAPGDPGDTRGGPRGDRRGPGGRGPGRGGSGGGRGPGGRSGGPGGGRDPGR